MTIYGKAAVLAVRSCQEDPKNTPIAAWNRALAKCSSSVETRKKVCPREAFLGLCAAGYVHGILPADYAQGEKNKDYAIEAAKLLRNTPALAKDKNELWQRVAGLNKHPNGQMGVVVALWQEGMLLKA